MHDLHVFNQPTLPSLSCTISLIPISALSLSLPLPPCQWWANILYPVALPQCWDLKNIHISVKTANRYAAHLATRALGHI